MLLSYHASYISLERTGGLLQRQNRATYVNWLFTMAVSELQLLVGDWISPMYKTNGSEMADLDWPFRSSRQHR